MSFCIHCGPEDFEYYLLCGFILKIIQSISYTRFPSFILTIYQNVKIYTEVLSEVFFRFLLRSPIDSPLLVRSVSLIVHVSGTLPSYGPCNILVVSLITRTSLYLVPPLSSGHLLLLCTMGHTTLLSFLSVPVTFLKLKMRDTLI